MATKDRDPVAKVFAALRWLVEDGAPSVGVRELAAALKVSPSSAFRLLSALSEAGFVEQNEATARYSLGLEFLRLSRIATSRSTYSTIAAHYMRKLADSCGETVLLCLYDRTRRQMMFTDAVDAPHPLRYVIDLNVWQPVHAGASGQAIMAFLPPEEIDAILGEKLESLTGETRLDPVVLREELAAIRMRGYACTRGQRIKGAVGLAAPIYNVSNEVIGDICVTIPEQRFDDARELVLSRMVTDCANAISATLGSSLVLH